MGSTYIDKYEYDIAMRNMASKDNVETLEKSVDRLNATVDLLDINFNKFEEIMMDLSKDVHSISDKLDTKVNASELAKLEEKLHAYATIEKVQRIDNRFVKYAKNEFVYDLRNKIETLTQNMKLLAPSTFVQEKIEEMATEIYSELTLYSTKKNVDEQFEANDKRFEEIKNEISEHLIKIYNTNEILKNVSDQGRK